MYLKFYVIEHPKLGYLKTKIYGELKWTDTVEDAKKWNRKSDATQSINKSIRFSDYFDERHVKEIQYIVTNIVSPLNNQ